MPLFGGAAPLFLVGAEKKSLSPPIPQSLEGAMGAGLDPDANAPKGSSVPQALPPCDAGVDVAGFVPNAANGSSSVVIVWVGVGSGRETNGSEATPDAGVRDAAGGEKKSS